MSPPVMNSYYLRLTPGYRLGLKVPLQKVCWLGGPAGGARARDCEQDWDLWLTPLLVEILGYMLADRSGVATMTQKRTCVHSIL